MDTYRKLITARKSCARCTVGNPLLIRNGSDYEFDPDVVSHWSQWLGHQAPQLLIVGQDFSNAEYFERNGGRDDPKSVTNANLRKLLQVAGIDVQAPPNRDSDAPVYLTNSILCLKSGSMIEPIKPRWIDACAQHHLAPLVQHLKPLVIVGMGAGGWRAVRKAFGVIAPEGILKAAGHEWATADGRRAFAVGHCSGLGLRNRAWSDQVEDWKLVGAALHVAARQLVTETTP